MQTVARPSLFLILVWWAFLAGAPGIIAGLVVYRLSPMLDLQGVQDLTTLPRFLILSIILSFGYGLSASVGFLIELPLSPSPFLGAILVGYAYVAGLLGIAVVRGIIDQPTLRTWFTAVVSIGTLLPVLSSGVVLLINY